MIDIYCCICKAIILHNKPFPKLLSGRMQTGHAAAQQFYRRKNEENCFKDRLIKLCNKQDTFVGPKLLSPTLKRLVLLIKKI